MNHNNKSASATAGTHTHTGRQGKRKRRTTSVKVARLFFGFSHGQLGDGTFRPAALSTHYDIIISPPSLSFWRSVYFFLVDKKLYLLCVVYIYLETPGGRKLRLYPHLFFFFFFFNKSTNFFSFFFVLFPSSSSSRLCLFTIWLLLLVLLHHHHHHLATGARAHIPVARLWAEMKLYYSTR